MHRLQTPSNVLCRCWKESGRRCARKCERGRVCTRQAKYSLLLLSTEQPPAILFRKLRGPPPTCAQICTSATTSSLNRPQATLTRCFVLQSLQALLPRWSTPSLHPSLVCQCCPSICHTRRLFNLTYAGFMMPLYNTVRTQFIGLRLNIAMLGDCST